MAKTIVQQAYDEKSKALHDAMRLEARTDALLFFQYAERFLQWAGNNSRHLTPEDGCRIMQLCTELAPIGLDAAESEIFREAV